jgi:hypothetical protein
LPSSFADADRTLDHDEARPVRRMTSCPLLVDC